MKEQIDTNNHTESHSVLSAITGAFEKIVLPEAGRNPDAEQIEQELYNPSSEGRDSFSYQGRKPKKRVFSLPKK